MTSLGPHDLTLLILQPLLTLTLFCSFYFPNTGLLTVCKHIKVLHSSGSLHPFSLLGILFAQPLCMAVSFHHSGFKFSERPTTLMLLSFFPPGTFAVTCLIFILILITLWNFFIYIHAYGLSSPLICSQQHL